MPDSCQTFKNDRYLKRKTMFITNGDKSIKLKQRISKIIDRTEELKILVGYFISLVGRKYTKALKKTQM